MALTPGTRLGVYDVTAAIGEGGMGQVFRARDTKLNRDVALKVLPDSLANDTERLARFTREAQTLAALNHPNIAAIYGLEESSGVRALVMELVEGDDLSQRIARGAIALDEALPIAKQIAEALEAAHEQGIIHRDLKPANIKVRADGMVKVLDFGLAKAMEPAFAQGASAGQAHASMSPTITTPAMTQAGMILGTAAYMSPEQARGKGTDKRTDIWAFGAVLYEMLTGRRAFAGAEISDAFASVLAREPDWTLLPPGLSPVLVIYIKRCLQKDRKLRIRDIGDVLLALSGAFDSPAPHGAHFMAVAQPVWRRALSFAATSAIVLVITGLAAWSLWPAAAPQAATRFDYVPPEGQLIASTQRPVVAISPDGRSFVYQTSEGLYLRLMGDLEGRLIPGTREPHSSPFVSPDGQWVAYFAMTGGQFSGSAQLKKMAVSGGAPVILCGATTPFGASWASDNTILFGQRAGIMRLSANGGTPELVVRADDGEQMYGPQLLPDGDSVLFSVTKEMGPNRWDLAQVVVQSLSSGRRTVVVQGGSDARYLSTGHIVYALRDGLFGIAFDAKHLKVSGGAVPLVQSVQQSVGVSGAGSNYAVSDGGTLVYVTGSTSSRSFVWMNRNGTAAGPIGSIPAGTYEEPRLSPDGSRILVTLNGDIWIYDVATGRSSRLTRDSRSLMGVWDPTGSQIAYSSARKGNLEAWVELSDGSGEARQMTTLGGQVHVDAWSPDGRTLTIHHHPPEGAVSILMLPMDGVDPKPQVFFKGDFNAEGADFSRDGRYVAYLAEETSQREIYIRPYRKPGGEVTVSVAGGREPVWAANGDVFYRSLTGERMFAVSVTTEPTLKVGKPLELFQGPYFVSPTGSPRPQYDVTADGQRFLMLVPAPGTSGSVPRPRMIVVQNWTEELKSLVPTR